MKENTRSLLRTLSGLTAGVGIILALGAAGTSDARDALQYEDDETREKIESTMISEKGERNMTRAAFVTLGLGAIGLILTEKKENQR